MAKSYNYEVMFDDTSIDVSKEVALVWSIANSLRGAYTSDKYKEVIIPMVIIRRFECALEETKNEVIAKHKENPSLPTAKLERISKYPFYNTSEFTLARLLNDSDNIADNFKSYIDGFSANVKSIISNLDFKKQIDKMDKNNRLYGVVKKFSDEGKLSLAPVIAKPYLLKDGDILFARSGATVGKTFYYQNSYGISAFAGYLIRARINRKMANPKFVYYSTLGVGYDNWKNTVFTQATIQNIGADKYSQFYVTLPSLSEQLRIVDYLDSRCATIDDLIMNKQQQLDTIQKHKKSLIYEYVTGKKRVKEAM